MSESSVSGRSDRPAVSVTEQRAAAGSASAAAAEWALSLFSKSVLKQAKFAQISVLLGDPRGRTCLDIGGDNGVISLLLRQRGGDWHSADLDATTVESIRRLVGENVHRIDGLSTPFPDTFFDVVVIVDFLEHVHTDHEFVRELARIIKPGGVLIINVPRLKRGSLLNLIRPAIGLTDEKHGHVRAGYDIAGLRALLGDDFVVETSRTYSGSFSEAIDTLLNAAYELRGRGRDPVPRSRKGTVITEAELSRYRKEFKLLSTLYPVLRAISSLDALLFAQKGYKLIVRAKRTSTRISEQG